MKTPLAVVIGNPVFDGSVLRVAAQEELDALRLDNEALRNRVAVLEKQLETVTKGGFEGIQAIANDNLVIKAERDELLADKELLDWLERALWSDGWGNGIALFPCTHRERGKLIYLQDMGDEDGSNLGEEITNGESTLRAAIHAARKAKP